MLTYNLNDYIRNYTLKDYGKGGAPTGTILDCSLGVNPEPIPQSVFNAIQHIADNELKHYPHDETILNEIAAYYKKKSISLSWLTKDHMYLGDGTTDILHCLNVLCLCHNLGSPAASKKVLGHAPQFTAYIDQVNCLGAIYDSYKMDQKKNYQFEVDQYINQMRDDHSLFIVENPNNPTGQIINLNDIRMIADRARSKGKILIVDEAYGDYMPIENSAINLVNDYSNVVVTRTFSKGFGMAGIRMGYLITSDEKISDTLEQFKKVENQFNCNSLARTLGIAFLKSGENIPNLNEIQNNKKMVMNGINKLTIATTALTTPIMTLYYLGKIPGNNLQTFLSDTVHLWTVSCATYDQLDQRAVRLMLPKTTDMATLIKMLQDAEAKI